MVSDSVNSHVSHRSASPMSATRAAGGTRRGRAARLGCLTGRGRSGVKFRSVLCRARLVVSVAGGVPVQSAGGLQARGVRPREASSVTQLRDTFRRRTSGPAIPNGRSILEAEIYSWVHSFGYGFLRDHRTSPRNIASWVGLQLPAMLPEVSRRI